MLHPSSLVVALVALSLFYASFDSGWFGNEPAPAGITAALGIFTVLFSLGAWATNATGDVKRSRLFAGVAIATGIYALGRAVAG